MSVDAEACPLAWPTLSTANFPAASATASRMMVPPGQCQEKKASQDPWALGLGGLGGLGGLTRRSRDDQDATCGASNCWNRRRFPKTTGNTKNIKVSQAPEVFDLGWLENYVL